MQLVWLTKHVLLLKTDTVVDKVPVEHPEVSADTISDQVLYALNKEEVASSSTAERDLTRVG